MRLKSLSIKGFKSFGEDTVIHFNEHVTGIVGPNGSGKSNIVDAFRWVLGEQSTKELRLEKMSDVIFNGSKSKKASKLAKVTLEFDNTKNILSTEFQNVSISRLLYQSGESEYRLNDVPCRLKDITSLFLDTGIGSNTYAIIALGMVDDILADKEHSRRRMFEQASGISKYKKRKKETLSKLKSTTEDLDRVEDLLFELKRNMRSLERQARNAQKYLEIKKEYQEHSVQLALHSSNKYLSRIREIEELLKKEQINHADILKRLKTEETILQKEKLDSLEREKELSAYQKQLNLQMAKLSQLESQKQIKIQKKNFSLETIERLSSQIKQAEDQISNLNISVQSLKEKQREDLKSEATLKNKVNIASQAYEELDNEKNLLKSSYDKKLGARYQLEQEMFENEKSLAVILNKKQNAFEDIKRFNSELSSKSTLIATQRTNINQIQEEKDLKIKSLEALRQSEEKRRDKMEEVRNSIESHNKELAKIRRALDAHQHEYNLLKSLVDNMEGFPESSKFLHHKWDDQAPILADILYADDDIKGVLEQYLGPYLHHFIVNDMNHAVSAITLLTESQKGKANFFVLDQLTKLDNIESSHPDLIPAKELVKTDPSFELLLHHLLHNVYFFEGPMDELRYADDYGDITILSKRGDFIKSNFSISGGSVGLFEGKKIGRKKHLKDLQKKLSKLKENQANLEEKLSSEEITYSQLSQQDNRKLIMEEEALLQNLKAKLIELEVSVNNYIELESASSGRIKSLQQDIKEYDKQEESLKGASTAISKRLNQLIKKEEQSGTKLDDLAGKLSQASDSLNKAKIDLIRKENELKSIQRDLEYNMRRSDELQIKMKKDQQHLLQIQQEQLTLENSILKLEEALVKQYEEKDIEENQLSDFEQKFYSSRSVIFDIEERIRLLNKKMSESQRNASELKEKLTNNRFKINALVDRIQIEFGLEKEEILKAEINEDFEYNDLEFSVEKLRDRLNKFGDINPMAVEAYEAIQERHTAISEQRDDILKAKDSLVETIKEIEGKATAQFMQSFTEVRENFKRVFRSLFTKEDDCDLIIEDPGNPLESDIDIIAKPKGKRPKSLSQLSGGEKTLTATALLFALYLQKPAPFCILDEVDAPLDDANVQKFNLLIKEFSRDSQFIVVTHNKATMAAVDVLYGVFMPEQGNSRVTAVDFRTHDYELTMQAVN